MHILIVQYTTTPHAKIMTLNGGVSQIINDESLLSEHDALKFALKTGRSDQEWDFNSRRNGAW